MKKMKKIILGLLVGLMVVSVAGCSKDTSEISEIQEPEVKEPEITGTLEEIMEQIYSNTELELPQTSISTINAENIEYFLGTADIEYVEAIASEPMMSSIAHSVALVRVAEGTDIEDVKTKIKSNVDGMKWICVGVEDDQIIVDNVGDLVILIMDKESETMHQSFLSLAK